MNGKYQTGQKVFLTGGNKNLIKEATVLKYTGGFYTIRFNNGGEIKAPYGYVLSADGQATVPKRSRGRIAGICHLRSLRHRYQ